MRLKNAILTVSAAAALIFGCAGAAYAVSVGTVDESALRLRSGATTASEILDTLPNGHKVLILEKNGEWYRVSNGGLLGYMYAEYLKNEPDAKCDLGDGEVTGSVVNLRDKPNTDGAVLTRLSKGARARILGTGGGWYYIEAGALKGYISPDYFAPVKGQGTAVTAPEPEVGVVTGSVVNVRARPDLGGAVLFKLSMGERAQIVSSLSGWTQINYNGAQGYISSDYFKPEEQAAAAIAASSASGLGQQIVSYARNYLNVAYVYGGSTPSGFDCSGFTTYVFKHFGITVNRTASAQYTQGVSVSRSALMPGDAVFFSNGDTAIGHVGIYIGDGKFIHASSPGDVVKITALSESYYASRYQGARRFW